MNNYTLTIVDTTGIQDYIFGTNHLKQNMAASYLVACATRQWVVESLDGLQLTHNVNDLDHATDAFTDDKIEDGELQAELLYAGGGNAVLLFTDAGNAVKFAKLLTRRTLLDAPGLKVVLAHQDFDWQNDALGGEEGVIQQTFQKLALRKANRTTSSPILGLGVTAACVYSGLPSIDIDMDKEQNRLISAQVKAKLDKVKQANERLKKLINFGDYEPAMDFDDFGRTEDESSYIAVIHADGNGMGQRIQDILDHVSDSSEGNRQCIEQLRAFSLSVQQAAIKAAQKTVDRVIDSIEIKQDKNIERKVIGEQIELRGNKLPFRPLVFGGDDTTFVCDGRLALHLTAYYLQQLSDSELTDGELMYSRAGIAIVHTHFPFSRAYALSEELAKSAKDYIKESLDDEDGLSAMDWHFASSGFILDLEKIREREYNVPNGNLLMRPLRITEPEEDWRSWPLFCTLVEAFRNGKNWVERQNKVKTLREVLRDGPIAVEHFLALYHGHELPEIEPQPDMKTQGWQGERCGYFDAIEAMDFFVALKEEVEAEK